MPIDTPKKITFSELLAFIREYFEECEYDSGGGELLSFPDFDLMYQDYLAYASEAISNPTDGNKINCISNLKRAIECEVDTFFHVLNLGKTIKKMNFPKKLLAIEALGLMPSRSLTKLNQIRNKVEGNLVRQGNEIEYYDYGTCEYKYGDVESVSSYGSSAEVEVYEYNTGEYRTFEMDR